MSERTVVRIVADRNTHSVVGPPWLYSAQYQKTGWFGRKVWRGIPGAYLCDTQDKALEQARRYLTPMPSAVVMEVDGTPR